MLLWLIGFVALAGASCPAGYTHYPLMSKCYYFEYKKLLTWPDAEQACQATGGHLVSLENAVENRFIWDIFSANEDTYFPWIGLSRPTPPKNQPFYVGWTWADGSNSTYRNFGGEYVYPNSTYAVLSIDDPPVWYTNWGPPDALQPYICSARYHTASVLQDAKANVELIHPDPRTRRYRPRDVQQNNST